MRRSYGRGRAACCRLAALLILSRGLGGGRGDEARAMVGPALAPWSGSVDWRARHGVAWPGRVRRARSACEQRVRPALALRGGSDADDALRAAILEAQQEAQQEAAAAEARAGRGHGQEQSQAGEESTGGAMGVPHAARGQQGRRTWRTARGVALPDHPQGVCQRLCACALRRRTPRRAASGERRAASG